MGMDIKGKGMFLQFLLYLEVFCFEGGCWGRVDEDESEDSC
jgi:hypothetical protein